MNSITRPSLTTNRANGSPSASNRSNWMLYGAYGTTGRRILDEALRRGHRPILAGRDPVQLLALGQATGLVILPVSLENKEALRLALSGVAVVMNAAGPFALTGPLLRATCVETGCSYLDVNGEIGDFGAALDCDAAARAAGIGIIPGAGYGVVFAESLAAYVSKRMPGANWLRLSLATQVEGRSRGANLSIAAALTNGGRDISEGRLRRQPLASVSWQTPGASAPQTSFSSAPLGELLAVHRSTGIPNIVAGIPVPRPAAVALRVAGPVLGKLMAWQARRPAKPSPRQTVANTSSLRSQVWAEIGDASGKRAAAMLTTVEGYHAAAVVAVRALEMQLQNHRVGALTPVQAFGTDLVSLLPDTTITDLAL